MENADVLRVSKLQDGELLSETLVLVKQEREVGLKIIHRLREIFRRRLYAQMGYSSLFTYLTGYLNYAEATAQGLVRASEILAEIPAVEEKIQTGKLSVSKIYRSG